MDNVTTTDIDWLRAEIADIKGIMEKILNKSDMQDDEISSLKTRVSVLETYQSNKKWNIEMWIIIFIFIAGQIIAIVK